MTRPSSNPPAAPPRPPAGFRITGAVLVDGSPRRADLEVRDGRVAPADGGVLFEVHLPGHALFPGLINAHDHLHLNALPRLRPRRTFADSSEWIRWVRQALEGEPPQRGLTASEPVRLWQGALKNLLAGATTVAHHDPRHPVLEHPDFPVRVPEIGWCHSLDLAGRYGPRVIDSLAATPSGRAWMIHLAEGAGAGARAELDRLVELGALVERTVLVHAVALGGPELERVIAAGAACVWCPASNLTILGATLDPRPLAAAGRLALGTDSRLTGADDLLAELRAAERTGSLERPQLLRAVTTDAARILRLDDVGRLAPGSRADLVAVRAGADPFAALLGAERGALRAVVLGGRPLVVDPDLADWCEACGVEVTSVRVDGHEKLVATSVLGPEGAADLEPGLELTALPRAP